MTSYHERVYGLHLKSLCIDGDVLHNYAVWLASSGPRKFIDCTDKVEDKSVKICHDDGVPATASDHDTRCRYGDHMTQLTVVKDRFMEKQSESPWKYQRLGVWHL